MRITISLKKSFSETIASRSLGIGTSNMIFVSWLRRSAALLMRFAIPITSRTAVSRRDVKSPETMLSVRENARSISLTRSWSLKSFRAREDQLTNLEQHFNVNDVLPKCRNRMVEHPGVDHAQESFAHFAEIMGCRP